MFRYRRYRVFLTFAFFAVFALYKFSRSDPSWSALEHVRPTKDKNEDSTRVEWHPNPHVAQDTNRLELDITIARTPLPEQTPPPPPPPVRPASRPLDEKPTLVPPRLDELDPKPTPQPVIHWTKPSQHFPVATESLARLPTANPKPIPKIQFDFKPETPAQKADREQKLNAIRNVAKRSWDGYRKHAWLQDELKPVTGDFKNPFAGWGATLVDSLDTLWIMGLKEEFDEAAKAVDQIDFTTTARADIPLFETTIRYLGGLLAAYDLSGKKYKNLLAKAEELGELLIAAFDTPNRMPETYYYWRPDFSLNPHRASNRAVLAEIGSMSMEFTRLTQLTGKDKYYDAVARITDRLEEFQKKTRLPGMWPTFIDISGCKRIDYSSTYKNQRPMAEGPGVGSPATSSNKKPSVPPTKPESLQADKPLSEDPRWAVDPDEVVGDVKPQEDPRKDKTAPMVKPAKSSPPQPGEKLSTQGQRYESLDIPPPLILIPGSPKKASDIKKRQLSAANGGAEKPVPPKSVPAPTPNNHDAAGAGDEADPLGNRPVCEEIGFASSSEYVEEEYTLGGMSDSTYEYLPKEYLLLGGVEQKYRTMYEAAMETITENLLFRPMLPDANDVLISGKLLVPSSRTAAGSSGNKLIPQQEHLTCFVGGMFGMGAKIFDRPKDLDLAVKITEGCVLSYNMTATGIMPEGFELIPCKSKEKCEWNKTKYLDTMDPYAEVRQANYKEAVEEYNKQFELANKQYEEELKAMGEQVTSTSAANPSPVYNGLAPLGAPPPPTPLAAAVGAGSHAIKPNSKQIEKRQLGGDDDSSLALDPSKPSPVFPAIYSPTAPASQEEYVTTRIEEERLPLGVTRIISRSYILRPEAIESVWYMYRITGDAYWREAGWKMFQAVNTATTTKWGNSAIEDVTAKSPELSDAMESFWFAETLKYFYLLFAEESVVSLDEWVLNTEAHPFKRPS